MIGRGYRRLHFGRKSVKVANESSSVPPSLIKAAQGLRMDVSANARGQTALQSGELFDKLIVLAKEAHNTSKVPESILNLISRTLVSQPNYKGSLSAENLQLIFRALIKHSEDLNLLTRLYLDLYRHSKLSKADKLENGREFYKSLRRQGHILESDKMVGALLADNEAAVTKNFLLDLCEFVYRNSKKHTALASSTLASGMMAIVRASPTTQLDEILSTCIEFLLKGNSLEGLEALASYTYFENPHFDVGPEILPLFLDAYLQFPNRNNRFGKRLLGLYLASLSLDTSLETCELLLMSCMHFQEQIEVGAPVRQHMIHNFSSNDYTKETWDVLAQWSVYSSTSPLSNLRETVLREMPSEYCDHVTFRAILNSASDKAQCSEQQISELVEFFESDLKISADAAIHEILINRALKAVEVESARRLFVESNADWNSNEDIHLGVLFDLLIACCKTPSIPRQAVMDTYQRVRLFTPRLSKAAQTAMLEMFMQSSANENLTPAGIFLIEQFGERPELPFGEYRQIFDLFFSRLMAARDSEHAWDLFGMLNCTVQLPYESYYPIQQKLCALGRPDAAHLLFRQLRNRSKEGGTRPPAEEMYLMLFAEFTRWKYEEGVQELETYFRMDLNCEMTPQMMNRMLAAYVSLNDSRKIQALWSEALALPKGGVHGVNNETLVIMMQYYTTSMGMDVVEDLWLKAPSYFKLAPTKLLLKQYLIANCYHGFYTRAFEILKLAPSEYNIGIDAELLRTLYNWTMLPGRKQEIKEFARENHPKEWAFLEAEAGSLQNILLPDADETGESDEVSRRLAAIKELQVDKDIELVTKAN